MNLSAGSDATALSPWIWIYHMTTGRTSYGDPILADESISGGEQDFKHHLAQDRAVWGPRPWKCQECQTVHYKNNFGDGMQYTYSEHPFFSVLWSLPGHPYSKGERFVVLLIGILASLFVSVMVQEPKWASLWAAGISAVQVRRCDRRGTRRLRHPSRLAYLLW